MLKGEGIDIQIWIDKATSNPILVEFFEDNLSQPHLTYSNFDFNADISLINTGIVIPAWYTETSAPKALFMAPRSGSINDFKYFLRLYAKYSNDGCFPKTVSIQRDKAGLDITVALCPIESEKVTESEYQELQIRGPRTYDFLRRMKSENDFHYNGQGIELGTDTPICWWKEDKAGDYTVIFGDLNVKNIKKEDLP